MATIPHAHKWPEPMSLFRPAWFNRRADSTGASDAGASARTDLPTPHTPASAPLLVAYASQTGVAEQLAHAACRRLQDAGLPAQLLDFYTLDSATLEHTRHALFLVSTTNDGDPPDMAATFSRQAMSHAAALAHLHYGLLALGDSNYDDFCAFGQQMRHWLQASGAQPWFDPIQVDDEDATALAQWHDRVTTVIRTLSSQPARASA